MTQRVNREVTGRTTERPRFGIKDRLGRDIGVRIATFAAVFTEASEEDTGCYRHEPGYFFGVNIQATRNGVEYGASQPNKYFKTIEERDAHIAKRLEESRKAAEKKAKEILPY